MRTTLKTGLLATSLTLALFGTVSMAAAQDRAKSFSEMSQQELIEIMKNAKPAPTTRPPADMMRSKGKNARIGFDLIQKREITEQADELSVPLAKKNKVPENRGIDAPKGPDGKANLELDDLQIDEAQSTTPTKPGPTTDTLTFPRRSVQKLLMRFDVNGTNFYWVCSASSRGSFHLLTAGHCLYSWDPNDDGNTSDRRWASEVWAWSGQTDIVSPFGTPDYPYGRAAATYMRSYTQWTNSADWNYDYGLLTMDRRIGDRTGWMGMEYGVSASSLNFTGYPVETPYVPAGTILQYPGFDSNNVDNYTSQRINMDAYVYGGHSGGPTYRYDSGSGTRNVQGINSTSNRVGSAGMTRITDYMFNDIVNARTADESARPPTPRPNMIEYTWVNNAKDLLTNSVQQGGAISLKWNTLNAGFAASSTVYIDAYLSSDTTITTGDRFIGTYTLGSVPAWEYRTGTTNFTVPASTPVGSYRVGWIMRTSLDQDPGDNSAVIASEFLQVTAAPTAPGAVTLLDPQGSIQQKKPTYKWLAASASPGWATSYQLEVYKKNGDQVFAMTKTASELGCSAGGTCQIRPDERLRDGRYSWKVRGSNAVGFGPYATTNFKVDRD